MKKRSLLFIILILIAPTLAIAQSKQKNKNDLEKWIIERLNKYSMPTKMGTISSSTQYKSDFNFSFQSDYLFVMYKSVIDIPVVYPSEFFYNQQCSWVTRIPVRSITKIFDKGGSLLYFNCVGHFVQNSATCFTSSNREGTKSETLNSLDPSFEVSFQVEAEKDLIKNLNKYFAILRKY